MRAERRKQPLVIARKQTPTFREYSATYLERLQRLSTKSHATINMELVVLRNILKEAMDDNLLLTLPVEGPKWQKHVTKERHLFEDADLAKRCKVAIEEVPATGQMVAEWLGHADNGALLARTYAHLSADHKQKMARKVTF